MLPYPCPPPSCPYRSSSTHHWHSSSSTFHLSIPSSIPVWIYGVPPLFPPLFGDPTLCGVCPLFYPPVDTKVPQLATIMLFWIGTLTPVLINFNGEGIRLVGDKGWKIDKYTHIFLNSTYFKENKISIYIVKKLDFSKHNSYIWKREGGLWKMFPIRNVPPKTSPLQLHLSTYYLTLLVWYCVDFT